MSKEKFNFILTNIVQVLCTNIKEKLNITYDEARSLLYHSKTYQALEDEDTKMWYFSKYDLLAMFLEELQTGQFKVYKG